MSQKSKNPIPRMPWSADHFWSLQPKTLITLIISLSLMGVGEGLLVLSQLGSRPWTVLSQGIHVQTGLNIGVVTAITSVIVMLGWIPLKLRFGLGSLLNILFISLFLGLTSHFLPPAESLWVRTALMVGGIVLFAINTAFYLTCLQGAGPRDGLMVGLCQHFHWRVFTVRTSLEVSVCLIGFLLGGTVGIGTLAFAFGIGTILQFTLLWFAQWQR